MSEVQKMKSHKYVALIAGLGMMLFVLAMGSFYVGRFTGAGFWDIPQILLYHLIPSITKTWSNAAEGVVLNLRLPRIAAAIVVGASLALSGTTYQALFSNPMASSNTLGVTSSAAFGAILGILLGMGTLGPKVVSFVFGCVVVLAVYLGSAQMSRGRNLTVYLVLIGMVVSSLFQAFLSILKYVADPIDQLPKITYWLMGSFSGVQLKDIPWCFAIFLLGCIPLWLLRWRLNLLSLSDSEARSMGENMNRLRLIAILCATLLSSSSVAITGGISWVGLIIPHIARMIAGQDMRKLLPTSALMGSIFLLLMDNLARGITVYELPISVLTSLIGAPIFFAILIKNKGRVADGD